MRITISGKGMEVSEYLKQTVEKKAGKLKRYFKPGTEVHVTLSIEKSRHIAEVTVQIDGVVLRSEEITGDMYSSIDIALKKMERQIRKHRTRLEKRLRSDAFKVETPSYGLDVDDYEDEKPEIVRVKRFVVKPMDVSEAQMQLELLGHSFFVFTNSKTNEINVIYKRKDGNFGLIEPDYV